MTEKLNDLLIRTRRAQDDVTRCHGCGQETLGQLENFCVVCHYVCRRRAAALEEVTTIRYNVLSERAERKGSSLCAIAPFRRNPAGDATSFPATPSAVELISRQTLRP